MADLTKTIYQKPVQAAASTAQAAARAAAAQGHETLKKAGEQLGVRPTESTPTGESDVPGVVQEIREQGPSNIDREAILQGERSRLAELESELKALQAKREQAKQQYQSEVQSQMQAHAAAPTPESFTAPQGKVKKVMGQVKKAVSNIMSRKQSETKMGTGKG